MKSDLGKAISIAAAAFENKTDKGGHPYILHCIRVMNAMPSSDHELQAIAVMHDLIEDTNWSFKDLYAEGFSMRVVTALQLLTHDKETSYDDYIKRLAHNVDARLVKLADLKDNSDITRMKGLTKADFDRLEKYQRSFAYLSKV
jgi:(p)ppGpp synthase/HD superfamily hydrolase